MERIQKAFLKARQEQVSAPHPQIVEAPVAGSNREAAWNGLNRVTLDRRALADHRIVTLERADPAHVAFDVMRTKILKTLRRNNWTTVGITSPTPGCGKTIVALNLAFSFANQIDCRTALVDLDLRRPQIGDVLGLKNPHSMQRFLTGEGSVEETFVRCTENLAVGANCRSASYAAEILQSGGTTQALDSLKRVLSPDVVLFDLPPMRVNDDVLAFLPHVDCMLLIAAAEVTTVSEIDICERELASETNVLGVVLNKCHYTAEKYGY